MSNEIEKMGLTSNREVPLSMYVYIVRNGYNNVVAVPQTVTCITAYSHEDALNTIRGAYPTGTQLTIEQKGQIPMKALLDNLQQTINFGAAGVVPKKQEPEIIARTKRDFYKEIIEGMIKSAADFTTTEPDKNVLLVALHKMLSIVS